MRVGALAVLAALVLATPATAAVTLSCQIITYETWDFTMIVDADAKTLRVQPDHFDRWSGQWFGGEYREDSREKHADFRDRYIDIWLVSDEIAAEHPASHSFGVRLDRQTLKLSPIGDRGAANSSFSPWVEEGSGCQVRVL